MHACPVGAAAALCISYLLYSTVSDRCLAASQPVGATGMNAAALQAATDNTTPKFAATSTSGATPIYYGGGDYLYRQAPPPRKSDEYEDDDSDLSAPDRLHRRPRGDTWPQCHGTCYAGVCQLQLPLSQCCFLSAARGTDDDSYGGSYGAQQQPSPPDDDAGGGGAMQAQVAAYKRSGDDGDTQKEELICGNDKPY